ncbi:MAG: dihydropteroate synthase [Oligoflexales bacterium]|nr:dihydropteroate synthase [Oligoflexales bacterium]
MIAREFNYNTTKIMGVINVTPDSFSDGGNFYSPEAALKQALKLEKEGADILDIGAESSRPGSEPIDAKTEWERLGPALSAIKQNCKNIKISVDSYRPETILRAVEEFGIDYVNCIKGVLEFSLL